MKNGIVINGKRYELVPIKEEDRPLICGQCDLLKLCERSHDFLCDIFGEFCVNYFKLKED
jgi:hypothetical protein